MLADKAKDGVSCSISVAPVVDWRFYGKYKVNFISSSLNECCESFSLVKKQESCWLTKPRMGFLCSIAVTPVINWRFHGKYKVYFKLNSLNGCWET